MVCHSLGSSGTAHRIHQGKLAYILAVITLAVQDIAQDGSNHFRRAVASPVAVPAVSAFWKCHKGSKLFAYPFPQSLRAEHSGDGLPFCTKFLLQKLCCTLYL